MHYKKHFESDITIKKYQFQIRRRLCLKNFSFQVKRTNHCTGGTVRKRKSTIANLLTRFYDERRYNQY
jgi:ABC-type multidrug transport system fused ATPase/permease subunit